jgi:hypothetical protein
MRRTVESLEQTTKKAHQTGREKVENGENLGKTHATKQGKMLLKH